MSDRDAPRLFDPALPDLDRNVAPVGHRHPETAVRAAVRALPRTGSKRRTVVEFVARAPATAEEIGAAYGWPHQSYSAAVSTLAADGWLVDSGERRATSAGNAAIVWALSPAARTALAESR